MCSQGQTTAMVSSKYMEMLNKVSRSPYLLGSTGAKVYSAVFR